MHFALITAPTITEFRTPEEIASKAVQRAALQPQLGILSVAAILEHWGDRPHLYDANAEYLRFAGSGTAEPIDSFANHLAAEAVRSNADVFGLSSICSTFPLSLRIAREIKALRPYSTILFGGPQASVVDREVIQSFPCVDLVLRGEVEESLPALLRQLTSDYDFSRVPGLTFRDGSTIRRTPNAPAIEDLDALPSPSYHLSSYLQGATSASVELGRGCPFSCTFCSTNDFFRRRFRLRSPARVLSDMRSIAAQYGIRHFELVHDMFTVDRKRVVAFCEAMRDSGEGFTWDCSARTDCVDEALLEEMFASGCRGLFFGIESGSVRMQRIIDKDLDPVRAAEMLLVAERLGMRTTASLITGFPEETWEDVRDTLKLYVASARCSLSHPQINLLAPLAGTPLHTQHAHELVLDEYCSDMSHQGLARSEEDEALIHRYPEIFPNFYMIPSPLLDRDTLFDLREWLGMAVDNFRWLLCAVAQAADILHVHAQWQAWRNVRRGRLNHSDSRRYYAMPDSRADFLEFICRSQIGKAPAIAALLHVEQSLLDAAADTQQIEPSGSVPIRLADGVRVLDLPYDVMELTACIAGGELLAPGQPRPYATRMEASGHVRLHAITPTLATILRACESNQIDVLTGLLPGHETSTGEEAADNPLPAFIAYLEDQRWITQCA